MAAARLLINGPSIAYVKSQLETNDNARTKRALQFICKLYRIGQRIGQGELIGVEQTIVGILYTRKSDEKIRRWALNALAQCGTRAISLECVLGIFKEFVDHPQTAAAAIAALYRMQPNPTKFIDALDIFDPQMRLLAALQHVPAAKLDLRGLPVNVETATADALKLALIVVGLNRSPLNMFHPRFGNAEIVRELGSHDDPVVTQYTVWAVAENDNLTIDNLGISITSVDSLAPNVRSWMYRAVAMDLPTAIRNQDYIANGAGDEEAEVRLGLAMGLKDTYYDGLEAVVLDWYFNEPDVEIQHSLMDHMVRHSGRCASYEQNAIAVFEKEAGNPLLRQRMTALAAKTDLFTRFQQISYDGMNDLFRSANKVTNNFNGPIVAGALSVGGNATNSGNTSVHYEPKTIELVRSELGKAVREIHQSGADPDLKELALEHVKAAQSDPTPETIKGAIGYLEKVDHAAEKAVNIGQNLSTIASIIGTVLTATGLM